MSIINFGSLKRRLQSLGVDTSVTYYALVLGALDGTTGQYARGYTPSTVDMILFPHAPTVSVLSSGVHAQNVATGFTDTQMFEGDRVEDCTGLDYVVTTVKDVAIGDRTVYYECELSMLFPGDISDTVYPWPSPPTTGGLSMNIGVATWDALSITCILNQTPVNTNDCEVCDELSSSFSTSTNTNDCEVCTVTTVLATNVV